MECELHFSAIGMETLQQNPPAGEPWPKHNSHHCLLSSFRKCPILVLCPILYVWRGKRPGTDIADCKFIDKLCLWNPRVRVLSLKKKN